MGMVVKGDGFRRRVLRIFFMACLAAGAGILMLLAVFAQQAAQAAGRGGAGGGRGGIPNVTPEQTAALSQMNADLATLVQALAAARAELVAATFAGVRDDAAIKVKAESVRAAELAVATARAEGLVKIQASANRLATVQIAALGVIGGRGGGAPVVNVPNMTSNQVAKLTQMTGITQKFMPAVTAARSAAANAAFGEPRDDAVIKAKVEAVVEAELALAKARADALAKIQESADKLSAEQLTVLAAAGGIISSGGFSEPLPMDFNDHAGYVALFDGKSLKGWDGNPKFWRVEDGAIIGESTPQNPSGNSYIAYRDIEAKDFTLKFEIKVAGAGGSGIQYRSKTGIPWLTAIPANVTANVGPVNLDWMMTGPQADFWPVRVYTGQFYSENTPMRIMAWRGQVVEGAGMGPRRLMGNIGEREALGKLVKADDWNQYVVMARGGTCLHIVNGQLMAVMVDDDPTSSNNQSGLIGIEIEATTKIWVRNIWLKKLN